MKRKRLYICSNCRRPLEESRRRTDQTYCLNCHAKYMRLNRPKYSDMSELQKKKSNARAYANSYVRRGKISKLPCVNCGSRESQMHHEDYNKPLEVTWMCRTCHLDIHKTFR